VTRPLSERKGARTGLITTGVFRYLIEIGQQTRPFVEIDSLPALINMSGPNRTDNRRLSS
jgi:N-methylhydantoinase A/oxoprolinase/acetone carboxylase beta subunit